MNKNDGTCVDIVTIMPYIIVKIIAGEGDRIKLTYRVFDGVNAQI